MGNSETPLSRSLSSLIIIAFFAGLFWMLFNEAMVRGVGHDEHQFIASGKLLAENGLLPYRDYPYFHMPYLVIVNALVSRITSYSFLGARAVSVLSALLTLGLIFSLAYRQFSNWSAFWRLAVSISSVVILAANPLFTYTSGQAWNHDFSTFLTLSGFLIFLQATQPGRGPGRLIISGVLLGLAAGVRLTYLVTGLPLVLALIFSPRLAEARDKLHSIGWFAMGWALALLPALFLFMLAPTQFLFGNLGYPQLNTLYRPPRDWVHGADEPGRQIRISVYQSVSGSGKRNAFSGPADLRYRSLAGPVPNGAENSRWAGDWFPSGDFTFRRCADPDTGLATILLRAVAVFCVDDDLWGLGTACSAQAKNRAAVSLFTAGGPERHHRLVAVSCLESAARYFPLVVCSCACHRVADRGSG